MATDKFDVFISHASEDKADFAKPLATILRRLGLRVWFDKFTLSVGDSLRASIEDGLSNSKYGVVIFSKNFLSKNWPGAELSALFGREMEGHKVILPVWHNISASEMRAVFPIQADKVALRSSDGVDAVAKAIVGVVRPELLAVDTQKRHAFDSASSLIDTAQAHYPGYAFTYHSGLHSGPPAPGTIASVTEGPNRIDIAISNPSLIEEEPKFNVTFSGDGAGKAEELYRTGKAQIWKAGEFTKISGTIPMMPTGDAHPFHVLTAGSDLRHLPPTYVRLIVGSTEPTIFPLLEMRLSRAGAQEAEATILHSSTPLQINFIFSIDELEGVETAFAWDFIGHSCSSCQKVIEVVDRLRKGDTLMLYNLQTDKLEIETPALADQLGDDPFPPELRQLVNIATEAEKRFGVVVRFNKSTSEQDAESLLFLDRLFHGGEYARNLCVPIVLTKRGCDTESAQRQFVSGQAIRLFLGPTNYPGFFPLFGTRIPTPPWGLFTDQCVVADVEAAKAKYSQASVGDQIHLDLVAHTPTYIRWKHDVAVLLGVVPSSGL